MPVHTKVSGVWRTAASPSAKVGGTWRAGKWWVKVGGVWRSTAQATHSTTISPGSRDDSYTTFYIPFPSVYVGYDANDFLPSAIGSMGTTSFADGRGVTRAITSVFSHYPSELLQLALSVPNVPNDDLSFKRLEINGYSYLRSSSFYDASVTAPYGGGNRTVWYWSNTTPQPWSPGTSPYTFKLFFD